MLELLDPYDARVATLWTGLANRSFFLSWGWIENWLACLPRRSAPRLAVWRDRWACFLGRRLIVRRGIVPSRALYLNTTGVERFDELVVEYNGVVGCEPTLDELLDEMPGRWDEVFLPGLRDDAFGGIVGHDAARHRVRVGRRVPAYIVELDRVRASGYHALLSSQTRSQLRRAQRLAGDVTIEIAGDARAAIAIYDELAALHGAQWRAKGMPGAFADPWFDRFHRRLIGTRFASGEIQLVRVRNATHTVGCLYNFVFDGRVLQYQSGLAMYDDARQKPGYVCHAAAIEHAASRGLGVYDLLAGDMRYKKSLSTSVGYLVWAVVQRRRLRFALEDRIVNAIRERRASAAARA